MVTKLESPRLRGSTPGGAWNAWPRVSSANQPGLSLQQPPPETGGHSLGGKAMPLVGGGPDVTTPNAVGGTAAGGIAVILACAAAPAEMGGP